MKLDDLLKKLGKEMDLPDLKLDANGGCVLVFDGRLRIFIESAPDMKRFYLYAVLCQIPTVDSERLALYDVLMEGHLFGIMSGGSTFGASPRFGGVVLSRVFDLDTITYPQFFDALELFVNAYETWVRRLGGGALPPSTEEVDKLMGKDK